MVHKSKPARPFTWTAQKKRAATLLAENELMDQEIAAQVGVSRTALWKWKQNAEFVLEVGDQIGQIQAAMLKLAIAKKYKRIAVLDALKQKVLQTIEERGVMY